MRLFHLDIGGAGGLVLLVFAFLGLDLGGEGLLFVILGVLGLLLLVGNVLHVRAVKGRGGSAVKIKLLIS